MSEFLIENGILKRYYGEGGKVIIPEGVSVIGECAFSFFNYGKITHLVIPNSVQKIEKKAFYTTTGTLNAMYWPHRNLESIEMSDELAKSLTLSSMKSKFNIETLIYGFLNHPEGFKGEFRNTMLKVIKKYQDETITAIIRHNELKLLINLIDIQKNITFDDILHFIEISEKENKNNDVTTYLKEYKNTNFKDKEEKTLNEDPNQRTLKDWRKEFKIGLKDSYAFINKYIGDQKNIIIPGIIGKYKTKINAEAFMETPKTKDGLESVILCDGVEEIGYRAFYDCRKLKKIYIPSSVTKIENIAFYYANAVTIYAPEGSYALRYAKKEGLRYKIGMWE